jgi:hypothetical protein
MRKVVFGLLFSVALLPAQMAMAGDTMSGDEAAIFGNLHLSAYDDVFVNTNPSTQQIGIIGGGKVAVPTQSALGMQFDAEGKYANSGMQFGTTANEGSQYDALLVAHGTFEVNDQLKLGMFGGYENINVNLTNIGSPLFSFRGVNNISKASSEENFMSIGGEALYAFTDENWAQVRVGFVKPTSSKASVTDRTTNITTNAVFDVSQYTGYQIGAGARFGIFDGFSMRADTNLISIIDGTGASITDVNSMLTGQYIFDASPFSVYSQIGYDKTFNATASSDTLYTRGGVTWSFGGPSHSTKNKLFRSAGFGGVFN